VPDVRLDELASFVNPERILPTTVEIVDIAGLIKGASKGEGLGNQFLGNIREVDAILHVVRCFEDDNVVHVDGNIDPVRDKEIIDTELILKDLETVEKRLDKAKKNSKTGDKAALKVVDFTTRLYAHMEQDKPARSMELQDGDNEILQQMLLLTAKPILYVCNVDDESINGGNALTKKFAEAIADENAQIMIISAGLESELNAFEDEEERAMFLEELGLKEPGLNQLIRSSYELLDLITYFTAGVKEVRAWTIRRGTKAPQAAGVIHTDFEKGFIRAEVIAYKDYVAYKSEQAVKEAGKMSVEGKEYTVADGDVMHFRFNV
ncbi:UNVERIFIED_CONTAM: hypothetical protein GTU68_067139, partial [Idotea baltica]|nr:hypothetical protein [Idotea baltica]